MNEVISTATDPTKDFKDRLAAKLKDDIGDLMPDDVLQAMCARAMEEMLFKPRTKTTNPGTYGEKRGELPSWFCETIADAAKPILQEIAAEYVERFKPQIREQVAEALKEHNVVITAVAALGQIMTDALRQETSTMNAMLHNVLAQINSRR